MKLTDLPQELLDTIAYHLDSHTDIYALSQICRALYPSPTVVKLAFHPDFRSDEYNLPLDHRFVTSLVTQLADWAVESPKNSDQLEKAIIDDGLDGLLILATKAAWVTMAEIETAAKAKDELHELFLEIDKHEHEQGRPAIIGGEGMKLGLINPHERVLGYIVYCALFHHEVDAILKYGLVPRDVPHLDGHLRTTYIGCCMVQKAYWVPHTDIPGRTIPVHVDWHLLDFSALAMSERGCLLQGFFRTGRIGECHDPLVLIQHLSPQERIFEDVCLHLGWPTLRMLLPSGIVEYEEMLKAIRFQVLTSDRGAGNHRERMGEDWAWVGFGGDMELAIQRSSYIEDAIFGKLMLFQDDDATSYLSAQTAEEGREGGEDEG